MSEVPIKDNVVPPYILNPAAEGAQFAPLSHGFIAAMKTGDLLQHVSHTHQNTPFEEFIDQGQLNIAQSTVVRILESDKGADAKPSIGLLIGSGAPENPHAKFMTINVKNLGEGHDFEKASSDQLSYCLMIKAVKQLKLPQPQRIYPVEIKGVSESGHYLKFATISDAQAFRQAASDGRIGNAMKEGLREFNLAFAELKAAIDVDVESLVQASMKADSDQDPETGQTRYRMIRTFADQNHGKDTARTEWSASRAQMEEILALKLCRVAKIDEPHMNHAEFSSQEVGGAKPKAEYGVVYSFNSLDDLKRFANAVREPLTVKAAMEAVRDDLKRGISKMPANTVDPEGLAHLGEKLASAGKGGHAIN